MLQPIKNKSRTLLAIYPRKSRLAIILAIVALLTYTPVVDWAFQLFIGTIPGTTYTIPYWIMLPSYLGALMLLILVVVEDIFYMREAVQKYTLKRLQSKRRTTKRRYSHS